MGAVALAAACGHHEFEPPDREERVQQARQSFSTQLFDSIAWASPEERDEAGNQVYVDRCRDCHGTLGAGGTDYAAQRGLTVPSLVEPVWAMAHLDSLRHAVYAGHEEGMPTFGTAGSVTLREIDAVASYVLNVLRPDALGQQPGS